MSKQDSLERLIEIREEMQELIQEASGLMRADFRNEFRSADSYWIPHIKSALGCDNYPTYSPTMESTLNSLEEETYEEDEDYID